MDIIEKKVITKEILDYIDSHYPHLMPEYKKIYLQKDNTYWNELASDLNSYCEKAGISYTNYFYHEKLVKEKNR